MASRCLGELVRKMGERVLKVIIPILRKNMAGEAAATRQGVCFGLKELLDNVSRQQLAEHLSTLLPTLQGALLDSDASVRQVSHKRMPAVCEAPMSPSVQQPVQRTILIH